MSEYEEEEYTEEVEENPKPKRRSKRVTSSKPSRKPIPASHPPVMLLENKETETSVYDVKGKLLHIKVGHPEWEMTNEELEFEIEKVEEKVAALLDDNDVDCLVLVTHYAVHVSVI